MAPLACASLAATLRRGAQAPHRPSALAPRAGAGDRPHKRACQTTGRPRACVGARRPSPPRCRRSL